ncbi:hypothetical protein BF95_00340 [Sphingobium sp. Ant17]|nr:hypothetical protein BF95_00340 [Sphingobium sp. Ant17]
MVGAAELVARAMLAPRMGSGRVPARLERRTRTRSPLAEERTTCRKVWFASVPGGSAASPVGRNWDEAQPATQVGVQLCAWAEPVAKIVAMQAKRTATRTLVEAFCRRRSRVMVQP